MKQVSRYWRQPQVVRKPKIAHPVRILLNKRFHEIKRLLMEFETHMVPTMPIPGDPVLIV